MNIPAVPIILLAALAQVPPTSDRSTGSARDDVKSAKAGASKLDGAAKLLDELKQMAARYRMAADSEPPRDLVLVPEPVLSWTNPLRGSVAGASFVWVADGRPEAIGSLFRYTGDDGKIVEDDEFQSLSTTGLTAARAGKPVWSPRGPGIAMGPIEGAPKPAASPSERLRQMRAMAKEFHAFLDTEKDKTELRLLPKPLYRYPVDRPDHSDGALFAFVQSTDPEVLLVIESRPVDKVAIWHYGFARMSMVNLRARHKNRDVWVVDWATDHQDPNRPYVTLRGDIRPD